MLFINNKKCPFCGEEIVKGICCRECSIELKDKLNKKIRKTQNCDFYTAPFLNISLIRDAIYKTKFENEDKFIDVFVYFMSLCETFDVDLLVGVPRFKGENKYKNINLSYALLERFKEYKRIKMSKKALKKIKETKNQHNIDFERRLNNLKGSFLANEKIVKGKNILIVDDMITTGATIDEIARECKNKGAKNVYAIAIAISKYTK